MRNLKIDIHTHILPPHWPDLSSKYGYGGWVSLVHDATPSSQANMFKDGKLFRRVECSCYSPAKRLEEMQATEVDVQVLSTVPVMFSYWAKPEDTLDLARYLNDHIAQVCAEDPSKFVGLGTLPMQKPSLAIVELRRCILELGLVGVQIGSHIKDWNLDHEALEPFWQEAERLGARVFVHPWDMEQQGRMAPYWFPWLVGMPCETTLAVTSMIFGGVFQRYPKLKVAFAHGGGSFFYTLGRIIKGWKENDREFMDNIWVDSLVHDEDSLKLMIEKMGGFKRIMLGSDYPFPLGEQHPGELVESCDWLGEEGRKAILGQNALEFFGLEENKFLPS